MNVSADSHTKTRRQWFRRRARDANKADPMEIDDGVKYVWKKLKAKCVKTGKY